MANTYTPRKKLIKITSQLRAGRVWHKSPTCWKKYTNCIDEWIGEGYRPDIARLYCRKHLTNC